jgi:NifU-like protein involved in Fe-S cluster formation
MVVDEDLQNLATIPDAQLISALESDIKPARLQCALLPLQALREGLQNYTSHD